jgi:uncharacterized membrane protein (TIGR02234 family)
LATGGVLGLVAASQVWGTATAEGSLSSVPQEITGNDLVPLASAVSLVSLASVLAVPAVRRVGRRIVGGLLIVLGGGVAIASWMVVFSLDQRVADWVTSSDTTEFAGAITSRPLWAVTMIAAGLLIFASGVLVVSRGPAWPQMSARYERPAGTAGRPGRPSRPSRDAWDALDHGEDPTQTS